MRDPTYPSVYRIKTRVLINQLARVAGCLEAVITFSPCGFIENCLHGNATVFDVFEKTTA